MQVLLQAKAATRGAVNAREAGYLKAAVSKCIDKASAVSFQLRNISIRTNHVVTGHGSHRPEDHHSLTCFHNNLRVGKSSWKSQP